MEDGFDHKFHEGNSNTTRRSRLVFEFPFELPFELPFFLGGISDVTPLSGLKSDLTQIALRQSKIPLGKNHPFSIFQGCQVFVNDQGHLGNPIKTKYEI